MLALFFFQSVGSNKFLFLSHEILPLTLPQLQENSGWEVSVLFHSVANL